MTYQEPNNGVDIPIKLCGPFNEDAIFAVVRKYLPQIWSTPYSICSNSRSNSKDMDNVTFHNDRVEVVINVKEYAPQAMRCNVTTDKVELIAQTENAYQNETGALQRSTTINRCYQLPQKVDPNRAICYLSSDGILVITVPWYQ